MTDKKQTIFLHGWGLDKNSFLSLANNLPNLEKILIDLPGFGKTELPKKAWGSFDYAKYIKQNFLKKNKKNILIGHSFGGKIAIKIASNYPDLVDKIILIASAGLRKKINFKKIIRKILKINSQDYNNAGVLKPILSRVVRENLTQDLKKIKCPVLLIWGQEDKETPIWIAKKMAKLIKNNKLIILPGINHHNILTLGANQIAHQIKISI